ncbi:polysaccharide lyase family 8 super-sandwich domain-containing protein [Flavobacterium sp. PL11]|uniref:polysaccharide lyase family 8 super-sandwich domain-containing protein n=1 Tax=Flavobacterium sp. PL11 TaxID=3071717 RepID=UPI002E142A69
MKIKLYSILFLLLISLQYSAYAQISSSGSWNPIGNVNLVIVTDDINNGDGVGDGALAIIGKSAVIGQGASYTFDGTMQIGQTISISTNTYNQRASYINLKVELYNLTDNKILAKTPSDIKFGTNDKVPVNTVLSYNPTANDLGDVLQVRYIRTDPDGNTSRVFAIDNLSLNGNFVSLSLGESCPFSISKDLPLLPSNTNIEAQIISAVNKFSTLYLGSTAPSTSALNSAVTAYNNLGITVTAGVINGNTQTNFQGLTFLKTFAQQLKANPADATTKTMANNTIWWIAKQFCSGSIPVDIQLYDYEDFARPAILLKDFLDPVVKNLFSYTLYQHSVQFEHFWAPVYDSAYQEANGAIITDVVYNIGDVLLAYSLWQDTPEERYRYMRAYKRYMNRYFSYTVGTTDGIKPDGTGFHHWVAYNNYMYSFNTAADILSYLTGTDFQVEEPNYKVFRDAFYAQFIQSNDYNFSGGPTGTQRTGTQALSTAGRNPQSRTNTLSQASLKRLAIVGGSILQLSTADPLLAGMYNRIYGIDTQFNSSTVTPFAGGFFQFNHAVAGVYRYENTKTLVFNKGFTNNMWGAEAYIGQNRYGRYQSYGALEVIYPGDRASGNGYDLTLNTSNSSWDWNFNPGTTVIRLPWADLHTERGRLDELQQKRFVGSLTLKNKNSALLSSIHGTFGMFAMDFQEKTGQGFSNIYGPEKHNSSFTFKKSNFFFDDIIVCLGSGISNNDTANETVTTLFQRLDNKGIGVNVNGTTQTSGTSTYAGTTANNWILSNYGTGFYLVSGNDNLVVKKEAQQTPNQNQTWPVTLTTPTNPINTYYTGYINHGTNPSNKSYEYVLKPNSSASEMQALDMAIQNANKPYIVRQQNSNAHIVEHIAKKIWGYAIFTAASNLTYDFITGVSGSCLVMTQLDQPNGTLLLSINNPDIGFTSQARTPSIAVTRQVTLQGEWTLNGTYPGVAVLPSNTNQTTIEFTLVDGLAKEVALTNAALSSQEFEKSAILVYPNPVSDIVTISGLEAVAIKNASIISILGQNLGNFKIRNNQIDVSNLSDGVYLLKLQFEDNKVVTRKIVIKK